LEGKIKCVVDPYSGEIFNIPNFCICDPIYKKIIKKDTNVQEKNIKIQLIYVYKNLSHFIQLSNKSNGKEIIKIFCELEKIKIEEHQIRLLFKGQEIKDDLELFHYNIEEEDIIQIMCRKLEN
jgi:uncharacterized ubiquitin-like protein YukD